MLHLKHELVRDWPPLAWLAVCRADCEAVQIYQGPKVETFEDWFCEAAWAGDFSAGEIDCADVVSGSGGRCRNNRITFVSSSATVDRLQFVHHSGAVLVSNSLPCLLHAAQASLHASYSRHNRDNNAPFVGAYRKVLATSAGPVQLIHADNLTWNGHTLTAESKPEYAPEFGCYREYVDYLTAQLAAIASNARDSRRKHSRFEMLATISTGYDWPAVAAIAAHCGCQRALTFTTANQGQDDSGSEIAGVLGMELVAVEQSAWQKRQLPEVPAFASGQHGPVIFTGGEEFVTGKLLLTGYFGDVIWDQDQRDAGSELPLSRGISGLGLTEFRLWAGFLNCPVTFFGAIARAVSLRSANRPKCRPM